MLFDFQDSKFSLRVRSHEREGIPEPVIRVAEALRHHRTKLNASLARMRVQKDAMKISQLIPDPATRKVYEANVLYPCYARVNPIKVRDVQTEVVNPLFNEGFMMVEDLKDLCKYGHKSVCFLEKDLVAFSHGCRRMLDVHNLVEEGCLILQVHTCT